MQRQYPEWIATGDVNGDGKADIVATIQNYSGTGCPMNEVAVFTGLGTGKFSKPVFYSTGASVQSNDVFLADVNGDGKPDIVISNADGTISVLLNKGKGTFGTASLITSVAALIPHLNALAIADFNGDGKLDIAAASYYPGSYSNNVYILLGNGDGTFQAPITVAAAPQYNYTNSLAAGDFNHDGKMDLLVTLEAQCSGYTALPPTLSSKARATARLPLGPRSARAATIRSIRWSATSMETGSWTRSSPGWRSTA